MTTLYLVMCLDNGQYQLATRTPFVSRESAGDFTATIAVSRAPIIVPLTDDELETIYGRFLLQKRPGTGRLPHGATPRLRRDTEQGIPLPLLPSFQKK